MTSGAMMFESNLRTDVLREESAEETAHIDLV